MPELPEVETIKNDLAPRLRGKKILAVKILAAKTVSPRPMQFKRALVGRQFANISRRGKLLIFHFASASRRAGGYQYLLVHLKMTGQLIFCRQDEIIAGGHANSKAEGEQLKAGATERFCQPGKYTRVIFSLAGGGQLFFNDLRRFGWLRLAGGNELAQILANFGPEPLAPEFNFNYLKQILANRRMNIKAALLNQSLIAGLGNIYADEALFAAGLRPTRPAASLKPAEIKKLAAAIKKIIKKAISARGTTFNNYRDGRGQAGNFRRYLKVYGRAGEKCRRCRQGIIQKIKVAGRGTHYCPVCQK